MRWMITAATLLVAPVHATIEGTFLDPAFVGEGWTVEAQNDLAFYTWYTYDDDGDPTFFTALCEISYQSVAVESLVLVQRCEGDLFRTEDFNDTERVGDFRVSYEYVDGVLIGNVDAAGTIRRIEPLNFAYARPVDQLIGIWTVVIVSGGGATLEADVLVFEGDGELTTGEPARLFNTLSGEEGFAYFDEDLDLFVAIVDTSDGLREGYFFAATDDKAAATGLVIDGSGEVVEEIDVALASSLANTQGETTLFDQFLLVQKRKQAPKRLEPLDPRVVHYAKERLIAGR